MKKTPLLEASLCYNIHDGRIEQAHIQRPLQRHLVWEQQWTPGYAPVRAGLKRTFKRLLVTEETVANSV